MPKFPEWMPKCCPGDALEADTTLFRACESSPPSDEDLTPHARSSVLRKQKQAANAGCMGYALSVWLSELDAVHAQGLFPQLGAKWHIYKARVTKDDGQLAATPSRQQPGHHSFWTYKGVDLKGRLTFALPPLVASDE